MNTFENNPELRSKIFEHLNSFLIIGAFDGLSHDDFIPKFNEKTNKEKSKIIFVEPIPEYFERLKSNLSVISSENVFLENTCIGVNRNEVEMTYFNPTSNGNKPWYIEGCACVVENGIPLNMHIREEIPNSDLLKITCPTITVEDVLKKYDMVNLDYLQIDTEGYDQRIVESINLKELDIKYLKFEAYYCDSEFLENIKNNSDNLGYYFFQDWDVHIVKKEIIDSL